jgi:hypothetical protein
MLLQSFIVPAVLFTRPLSGPCGSLPGIRSIRGPIVLLTVLSISDNQVCQLEQTIGGAGQSLRAAEVDGVLDTHTILPREDNRWPRIRS